VSLPDNDRTWFSAGAQWTVGKGGTIDAGVTYLLLNNSQIDNNQLADGRGRITGEYSANAWLFGLQYSRAF
jgi:long-chain fatty acid transport protein